ncbi:MAG: RagB/SusD family nutrient uptake outer membrane protein, partial [Rikenellaceae bacterium]
DNIGFDDKEDYRRKELLTANKSGYYYIPNKHIAPTVPSATSEQVADMLPMIRLSEMHYITAEAYASKNDFVKATEALDQVRAGRNCKTGILKITDKSSFETELIKEVKREFVCEGQAFFYYKKLNILPRTKFSESVFVLPLPENENVN